MLRSGWSRHHRQGRQLLQQMKRNKRVFPHLERKLPSPSPTTKATSPTTNTSFVSEQFRISSIISHRFSRWDVCRYFRAFPPHASHSTFLSLPHKSNLFRRCASHLHLCFSSYQLKMSLLTLSSSLLGATSSLFGPSQPFLGAGLTEVDYMHGRSLAGPLPCPGFVNYSAQSLNGGTIKASGWYLIGIVIALFLTLLFELIPIDLAVIFSVLLLYAYGVFSPTEIIIGKDDIFGNVGTSTVASIAMLLIVAQALVGTGAIDVSAFSIGTRL